MSYYDAKEHPINKAWKDYYVLLEGIRQSGICNMWGASPVLADFAGITQSLARDILLSWIANYDELCDLYWPDRTQRIQVGA